MGGGSTGLRSGEGSIRNFPRDSVQLHLFPCPAQLLRAWAAV